MSVKAFVFFEDYPNPVPDYRDYEDDLMAFQEVVGAENFSHQIDGMLTISHFIGFFAKGNNSFQVLPKIYSRTHLRAATQDEIDASLQFIFHLLYEVGYFRCKPLSPQAISAYKGDLLEVFITIFAEEFNQLIRRKTFQQYLPFEEKPAVYQRKDSFSGDDTAESNYPTH